MNVRVIMKEKKSKVTLPSFVTSISGGEYDSLEDLILNRYTECRYVYYLLYDSIDMIKEVCHSEKKEGRLSIRVNTYSDKDAVYIKKKIVKYQSSEENKYNIVVNTEDNSVTIRIDK